MRLLCWFGIHKWSGWEIIDKAGGPIFYFGLKRTCKRCNDIKTKTA